MITRVGNRSEGDYLPQTVFSSRGNFYDGQFDVQRLFWPDLNDTVDAIAYHSIDITEFLEWWGAVSERGITGCNVAFIARRGDSLVKLSSMTPVAGRDEAEGSRISSLQWVKFGSDFDNVLSVTITRDFGQISGHGTDTRMQLWLEESGHLRKLVSVVSDEYNSSGEVYNFLGVPSFQDVYHDGESEMLIQRTYGYGTEWRSDCTEPCPSVWRLHDRKLQVCGILAPGGRLVRTSARQPILVYPHGTENPSLRRRKLTPPTGSGGTNRFNPDRMSQHIRLLIGVSRGAPALRATASRRRERAQPQCGSTAPACILS